MNNVEYVMNKVIWFYILVLNAKEQINTFIINVSNNNFDLILIIFK